MENLPKLIEAISMLLWPILILLAFLVFKPAVAALIESAKSRKFTLKLGGQELTMEEISQQQRSVLTSLEKEIMLLKNDFKVIKTLSHTNDSAPQTIEIVSTKDNEIRSILWVDDNPKNNGYHVQQLLDMDINVDLALSTSAALKRFNRKNYDTIISDMGRQEDNKFCPSAGLDLLKSIREIDSDIPLAFFTRTKTAKARRKEVLSLGGTGITSSHIELFQLLNISTET